jgi:hypothetical protein
LVPLATAATQDIRAAAYQAILDSVDTLEKKAIRGSKAFKATQDFLVTVDTQGAGFLGIPDFLDIQAAE